MAEHPASSSTTPVVPDQPALRYRGVPDVPQDVDFLMEHLNDPNFDYESCSQWDTSTSTDACELGRQKGYDCSTAYSDSQSRSARYSINSGTMPSSVFDYDDESPYPEVRAAVSSVDDPTMLVNTFRMWFIGLLYTIFISALNQFLVMRYPSVIISSIIALLTSLPFGKALEHVLPTTRFNTFGYTWSLNPGPFTIKEHVLITVMANVVVGGAYVTDILATQRHFYQQSLSNSYQFLLVLVTQLIGFSMGGLLRRFLVYPASMLWPGALVNAALFNALHKTYGKSEHRHISRERFFCMTVLGSFVWYWFPGYIWTGLSVFNWVCWIVPTNVAVNSLFGTSTGLGMGFLTFDWAMISYVVSPLVVPWWSEANTAIGLVLFFWIFAPILYFTNTWYLQYMPMSTSVTFDNTGMPYDPTQIVTNGVFDVTKYAAYSPVFMPTAISVAYAISFASFSAVLVHTFLWYRHDIAKRIRADIRDERDVHARLMQAYPEAPQWWYAILGITTLIVFFIVVSVFPTQFPIWALCVCLALSALLCVPVGIIQAITNQQVALNVIYELVGGYLVPGRPVAVMLFKGTAYAATVQAIGFSSDLKLGHYMKIPPRLMFTAQVVAAFLSGLVVTAVQNWMFDNIVDFCEPDQPQHFTCPSTRVFASASLIWGGVGPQRLFGPGQMYNPLLWFFLVGALLPVPFYYLARWYPLSFWRYVNVPILFAGVTSIPPASGINYSSWIVVGCIFQYFMRRYHFRWWMRYNYILSAGLDAGVAIGMVVIFLVLGLPKGGISLNWWGNVAWQNTADAMGMPMRTVAEGQIFGPSSWS